MSKTFANSNLPNTRIWKGKGDLSKRLGVEHSSRKVDPTRLQKSSSSGGQLRGSDDLSKAHATKLCSLREKGNGARTSAVPLNRTRCEEDQHKCLLGLCEYQLWGLPKEGQHNAPFQEKDLSKNVPNVNPELITCHLKVSYTLNGKSGRKS